MRLPASYIKAVLQRFDKDGNGWLEREQFNQAIVEIIRQEKIVQLDLTTDEEGHLTEDEEVHLTEEELDALWKKADRDENNRISLFELGRLVEKL